MLKLKTIKSKILISFLVVVLFPFFLVVFISTDTIKRELGHEINNNLLLLAEAKEGQTFEYLDFVKARTEDFASDGLIRDALNTYNLAYDPFVDLKINRLLKEKKELDDHLLGTFVLDSSGKVIAATEREEIGGDESRDNYFKEGRLGYYLEYTSHYHFGDNKLLVASAPIKHQEKNITLGVLVNFYSLDKINAILSGSFQQEQGALSYKGGMRESMNIYLVDSGKNIFAFSEKNSFSRTDSIIRESSDVYPVKACTEDRREVLAEYLNFENKLVKGASMCLLDQGWTLVVEISKEELESTVRGAYDKLLSMFVGVLILVLLLVWYIANLITSPIKDMASAMESVSKGRYSSRVSANTDDELGDLARNFNKMAGLMQDNDSATRKKIEEKTKHLEKMNEVMVGRELKMLKLKKQLLELKRKKKQ